MPFKFQVPSNWLSFDCFFSSSFSKRLLHSDRENIPDVPAVYFCVPSEDNVDRICRDLQVN